jgi:hypothetical protein
MCAYNPAHPSNTYLNLGNSISALGFTLAIQQLLKPIYRFRLTSYGIKYWHLILGIFFGFFCTFIAALLPNFSHSYSYIIEYPIFWEFLGAISIASVYGIAAYCILQPTHIWNFNLVTFIRSAGTLLSEATDEDRVKFAGDLSQNITSLFKYARAWDIADWKFSSLEFERLRLKGKEQVIQGPPPICPFYIFAHRHELERASFSGTLLRLLSDRKFCSTLVRECPWHTALIVNRIGQNRLHTRQAESFIQQLAYQAILNEDSMMTREVEYDGFGEAPLLSESLFTNWFILSNYRPLNKLSFQWRTVISDGYLARFNTASKMMLNTALKNKDYWNLRYMYDVESAYKQLFQQIRRKNEKSDEFFPEVELHSGVSKLFQMTSETLEKMEEKELKSFYCTEAERSDDHLIGTVATIIYDSFAEIANSFEGSKDRFWSHAIGMFMDIYPSDSNAPVGMNPLQQQIAVKFAKKLDRNMQGWYPAVSRVLLSVIGPYDKHPEIVNKTAYKILKDIVYKKLQKLPELYLKKPEKITDFLPPNVQYDHINNTLIYEYSDGSKKETKLSELVIPEINLLDESNWKV